MKVREWLVGIYKEYGKSLYISIGRLLNGYEFFLLYDKDNEFRSISYDCYSELIKKLPFCEIKQKRFFYL